jgi:phage terminase large subunit
MKVKVNWSDNPWFPAVLQAERLTDLALYPDRYQHIWEGDYAKAFEGAYFAEELARCRQEGRICEIFRDDLLPLKAFFDLGFTDSMSIWIVQWVGQEIRMLDYLEGSGQVLAYYTSELRKRGYGSAECFLPHDGVNANSITGKRYEDHLRDAGFNTRVIPNNGLGAAMMRIESIRRIFHRCLFHEESTEAGRDALGFYHERKDAQRDVGLGPEHDWSSHAALAFGLMALCYEDPSRFRAAVVLPKNDCPLPPIKTMDCTWCRGEPMQQED